VRKRVGGHDEAILSQGFWSYIFLRRSDASYVFSCESGQTESQGLIISTITRELCVYAGRGINHPDSAHGLS
jgi:hypothetical protein